MNRRLFSDKPKKTLPDAGLNAIAMARQAALLLLATQ